MLAEIIDEIEEIRERLLVVQRDLEKMEPPPPTGESYEATGASRRRL
jgi:hypothetical protein